MFKRALRVILSKTFAFALLIILQVVLFCLLIYWFAGTGAIAYTFITIVTVLVLVAVLEQDELNPAYKLMWVMVITLMPVFGALFYLMWGHRTIPRRKRRRMAEIEHRCSRTMTQDNAVVAALKEQDDELSQCAVYLQNHAYAPLYPSAGTEYYPLGENFFPRFLDAVRGAKKSVFMQYYIWEEGYMLDTTLELLYQKAAEGVDVRIIWDGLGSLFTLPFKTIREMRAKGIKCHPFAPIELTAHLSDYAMLNHRDHRKMTVVDGEVAFSGGLNFADEYINVKERFGEWKDTSFLVTGPAVYSMTACFLSAWDYVSGEDSELEAWLPAAQKHPPKPGLSLENGYLQPYWDSPLDNENVSENAYLNIIRHAKEYVYISTPYLILDHEMITNLTLSAKSGVDVRILTPGIPDKPTVFLVTQSYYPVLLAGGVRIYEYTPGFNHAKMYVSDDKAAIIGSANMDYRSLYLHFENSVAFYGGEMVQQAKEDMVKSFAKAKEITLATARDIPLHRRVIQIIAKFFAPLL